MRNLLLVLMVLGMIGFTAHKLPVSKDLVIGKNVFFE